MKSPAQIIFRGASPSPALFMRIQRELGRLERHGADIEHCRVTIAALRSRRPRDSRLEVEIELHLSGREIVVNHTPSIRQLRRSPRSSPSRVAETKAAHKEVYEAVRHTFAIADRLLQERKRVRRSRGGIRTIS